MQRLSLIKTYIYYRGSLGLIYFLSQQPIYIQHPYSVYKKCQTLKMDIKKASKPNGLINLRKEHLPQRHIYIL